MTDLTSTQAFWLGHLFHASSQQLALSEYAVEQRLVSRVAVYPLISRRSTNLAVTGYRQEHLTLA
ncbi:hypothetical protein RVM26_13000 [Halomonas sp. KM072]